LKTAHIKFFRALARARSAARQRENNPLAQSLDGAPIPGPRSQPEISKNGGEVALGINCSRENRLPLWTCKGDITGGQNFK
jgi:hypothetical protein